MFKTFNSHRNHYRLFRRAFYIFMGATSSIDRHWFWTWTRRLGHKQQILIWSLLRIARKLSYSFGTTSNESCFLMDISRRGTVFLILLTTVWARCLVKLSWAWRTSAWTTLFIWWARLFMLICPGGKMQHIKPSRSSSRRRQERKFVAQGSPLMRGYSSCIIRASSKNVLVVLQKRLLTFGRPTSENNLSLTTTKTSSSWWTMRHTFRH